MAGTSYLEYKIQVFKDSETGLIVAEAPTLGIADDGRDEREALSNLQKMVVFHLECLIEEGQAIPVEKRRGEASPPSVILSGEKNLVFRYPLPRSNP